MRSKAMAIVAIAGLVLVAGPTHAQGTSSACKLLQPAEIESALKEWASGGKAGGSTGESANSGGITMETCHSEIVRSNGNLVVNVIVVKNHPMNGDDFIKMRNEAASREGRWKAA